MKSHSPNHVWSKQRSSQVISEIFFCFIYGQFNAMSVTYAHVIHGIKTRSLNNSKTFCESVRAV